MPQTILVFSDEQEIEAKKAMQAMEYSSAVHSFREYLRGLNKYGHEFKTADEACTEIQNRFFEEFEGLLEN